MTGFRIDPEALEAAIRKLEDARDRAAEAVSKSGGVEPGELTAKDSITGQARQKFIDRANGGSESLRVSAAAIRDKLTGKIDSYRATLEEYRQADDNASVDAGRVDRRA